MKKILLLSSIFLASFSFAQLENANWCFGINANVNFNPLPPSSTSASAIGWGNPGSSVRGSSVSNSAGQLLFYTDGINIWNGSNQQILNGANGNGIYGWSSIGVQNSVIVPKPGYPNLYYVFTLGSMGIIDLGDMPLGRGGIHYSVVDMSNGTGQVVPGLKNISIKNHNGVPIDYAFDYAHTEDNPVFLDMRSRMTTTIHADGEKIWVSIIPDFYFNHQHTRYFYNFLITQDGINGLADGVSPQPYVSSLLPVSNYGNHWQWSNGSMKISPNGQFMCDAEEIVVNLYNYDNTNGTITLPPTTIFNPGWNGYHSVGFGIEFSPDSKLVYFTDNPYGFLQSGLSGSDSTNIKDHASLYQYDIQSQRLRIIYDYPVLTSDIITPLPVEAPFGIQLGIDDKIYVCAYGHLQEYRDNLGVINNPNVVGTGCNFVPDGFQLLANTFQNGFLPQWVHKAITVPVSGLWTWMKGDDIPNQYGIYGIQGVSSPNNKPGARYNSMTWTDVPGNLWLFGGLQYSSNPLNTRFNDLWRYNIATNEWTWMKGDNIYNQYGVYGTQGVASSSNKPGARQASVTWIDLSGNLWLFGGEGYDASSPNTGGLNDLWKYDVTTNQWTWMHGNNILNQQGIYGTQGVPSPTNKPGNRAYSVSWVDASGNLWLYGGSSNTQKLDDLWKYDISTNQWTWVNGNTFWGTPVYGTQGVPSSNNTPGSRGYSVTWKDAAGDLWLFGGSNTGHPLVVQNDLWKYNISTNQWTWVSGDNTTNQPGVYGTQGNPSPTNKPGARRNMVSWTGTNENYLWLWGGIGYSSAYGSLNDLWRYNVATNQWTWMSGANIPNPTGTYGTQGIGTSSTIPPGKGGSSAWIDNVGYLWLFGGYSNQGIRNDLWRYTACIGPGCKLISNKSIQSVPENNLNSVSKVSDIIFPDIQLMEIYNASGQLLRKINSSISYYEVIKKSAGLGLIPGLYYVRIIYKDKTSKTLKKALY